MARYLSPPAQIPVINSLLYLLLLQYEPFPIAELPKLRFLDLRGSDCMLDNIS